MSLIDHFWPFLKILQILGCFPIFKSKTDAELQPQSTCKYLLHYCMTTLIIVTGYLTTFAISATKEPIRDQFLGSSLTNTIALLLTMSSFTIINLSITWNNIWNKSKLSEVVNELKDQKKIVISRRQKAALYGIIFATLLKPCLSSVGLALLYIESHQFTSLQVLGTAVTNFLMVIWLNGPLISFIIVLADISSLLIYWLKESSVNIDFERSQQAIHCLKKANDVISGYLCPIISMMLLGITTTVYTGISIAFQYGFSNRSINIMATSYTIFYINYTFMIYYLNHLSFSVSKEVNTFKETLINTCHSKYHGLIWHLDGFKGFDCSGFFVLGRPLFTSITATFVTYVIILIQFKLAENSVDPMQSNETNYPLSQFNNTT